MKKGIIFDHDGTLVESEHEHYKIWRNIVHEFGHELSEEVYIANYSGVPTVQNAEMLIEMFKLPLSVEALCERKKQDMAHFLTHGHFAPMPFAPEILPLCTQHGLKLAIASGAKRAEIDHSRACHGYDEYCQVFVTYEDVENSKPAPDAYELAASQLGLEISECIAVEDSNSGVTSAKAAGMYCIAIPNAYSSKQDLSAADITLDSLEAAWAHIQQLSTVQPA